MRLIVCVIFCCLAFGLYGQTSNLPSCYHTYDEIIAQLEAWQTQYPNLLKVEIIGYTSGAPYCDPIPVYAAKLSNNAQVEEDEPNLLFVGQCHAEEVIGIEICLDNIKTLLTHQGQYPYSVWLNTMQLWFVPTINPEGLQIVHFGDDVTYRKTQRDANGNGVFEDTPGMGNDIDGVDPNRNYDFAWVHGDSLHDTTHHLTEPFDYYRGPAPFSEGGNAAIRDLADREHFIYSINWHSSRSVTSELGEGVFYPWQFDAFPNRNAPDLAISQEIGEGVAAQILTFDGTAAYEPAASQGRYGASTVWFYAAYGTIQLTIETSSIQPDSLDLMDIVHKCDQGVYWMLNRTLNGLTDRCPLLTGHVTDAVTGLPLRAEVIIQERQSPYFSPRMTESQYGRYWRPLDPGTYTLIVRKPGYATYTGAVTVYGSSWTTRDVALSPVTPGVYTGTVKRDGTLTDGQIITYSIETDTVAVNGGNFTFTVDPGETPIQVTAEGAYPYIGTLPAGSGPHGLYFDLTSANVLFSEDWESGTDGWTVDGPWVVEHALAHTGSAITDSWSGEGFYDPYANVSITTANPISLNGINNAMLTFWQQVYTEPDFAPCTVEVAVDSDTTWTTLYTISGKHDSWQQAFVSLDNYIGHSVRLRFHLTANCPGVDLVDPGWTIDDIQVISGQSTIASNGDNVLPRSTLKQNYPNPFNPVTTIAFSVTKANFRHAEIQIFNVRGQKVQSLPLTPADCERGSITWNASHQPSGIYMYRLVVDGTSFQTRKACLIK